MAGDNGEEGISRVPATGGAMEVQEVIPGSSSCDMMESSEAAAAGGDGGGGEGQPSGRSSEGSELRSSYENGEGHGKHVLVGMWLPRTENVKSLFESVKEAQFNYLVVQNVLSDEYVRCRLEGLVDPHPEMPYAWYDRDLDVSDWNNKVVVMLRNLDEHLMGGNDLMRRRATQVMLNEFKYAQHLGLPVLICDLLRRDCSNLAQIIYSQLTAGTVPTIWMKVPMYFPEEVDDMIDWDLPPVKSSWRMWNDFRVHCNSHSNLFPVIEVPVELPDQRILDRWYGESIKAIVMSRKVFLSNKKGFPVLSKSHQRVVGRFMDLGAQIILSCEDMDNPSLKEPFWYKEYLGFLKAKMPIDWDLYTDGHGGRFALGYEDCLQVPLQPLKDDLESMTYDTFEKDPIKYDLYKDATVKALLDKIPDSKADSEIAVVMVVGAGRGPLVRKALEAAAQANRKIRVYAVEKNFGAVNTLNHMKQKEWMQDSVTIVKSDMREWNAPEKADIMISELIGSFGDNELSPECLDGAQRFLKSDGIMIPQSYTSYVSPIMSSKLWTEARNSPARSFQTQKYYTQLETPYVVHMRTRYEIDQPKKLFRFQHPKTDLNESNDREESILFKATQDCVLHGFAGYFESTLYGSIIMSILPKSFSHGMFSWFPMFFPLLEPQNVKAGDTIAVHFWRKSNPTSVWYEWTVTSPFKSHIHNINGRSNNIGLR